MRPKQSVRITLIVQGVLLGLLAVAGLVMALRSGGVGDVLGFQLGILHSVVLLAVAVAGVLVAPRLRPTQIFVTAQMAGFALLFVIGSAVGAGVPRDTVLSLNRADHFLHLGLAVIGLTLVMYMAAPWAAGDRELGEG